MILVRGATGHVGRAVVCRLPSLGHDLFAMAPTHDDRPLTVIPPMSVQEVVDTIYKTCEDVVGTTVQP